ncbi:MAG: 30S ribosomal protein S2 [Candidatus Babeliales bacterium]
MIDLKELLKAGVHFGHKASRWDPKMRPFIWGVKNNVHLIDIAKTAFLLERAGKYLKNLASNGQTILWIGTKKAATDIIKKHAVELNMPFVINRWIGGTLTNFDQVKKAITRYLHLNDVIKRGSSRYKKKELSMIQKEIDRLENNIGGIINLSFPPGAIVIIDAKKETSAIREALSVNIPVVGMVDTNTDPSGVNFLIPSNDDSPRSIAFIINYLAKCVEEGKKEFVQKKSEQKSLDEKTYKKAKISIQKEDIATMPIEPGKETNHRKETAIKEEILQAEDELEIEPNKKVGKDKNASYNKASKTTKSTSRK